MPRPFKACKAMLSASAAEGAADDGSDDDELDLGIDADALALAEFLRTLVGSAADDWTDGGFVPPSLAVTGTLTVETPRPGAAESVPREVPAFERLQETRGNRLAKTLLV